MLLSPCFTELEGKNLFYKILWRVLPPPMDWLGVIVSFFCSGDLIANASISCFLPMLLKGSAPPVIGMKLLASAFLSIVNGEEAE